MNKRRIASFFKYLLPRIKTWYFVKSFHYSPMQSVAREIMEENFLGIDEMAEIFSVVPGNNFIAEMSEIPFHLCILSVHRKDHILIPILPVSIREITDKYPWVKSWLSYYHHDTMSFELSSTESWLDEKPKAGWYLVRKTHLPNSGLKSLPEQKDLLESGYEFASAQIILHAMVGHFLMQDELLFEETGVRTCTQDYNCDEVTIIPASIRTNKLSRAIKIQGMEPTHSRARAGIATCLKPTR